MKLHASFPGFCRMMRDPGTWTRSLVLWNPKAGTADKLAWAGSGGEPVDPKREALADLCHVLLNTNEFFYLH